MLKLKMNTRLTTLAAVLLSSAGVIPTAQAEWRFGLDTHELYTRWYEYPGTYFEETFNLVGLRAENVQITREPGTFNFGWGIGGNLYPGVEYKDGWGTSNSAAGVQADLFGEAQFGMGESAALIGRAGVSYTAAFGKSDGSSGAHSADFTVTAPLLFGAAGAEFSLGDTGHITLLYHFALAELGIATDAWVQGSPALEDWGSGGFTLLYSSGF